MAERKARRRRTAEEARREILDAAQKRLTAGGPEAVRLQEVAADVGISHSAVLHHFSSREGLLEALALRAMGDLNEELLETIEHGDAATDAYLDRVFETLSNAGHARLLAWRSLSGRGQSEPLERQHMRELIDAAHRRIDDQARRIGAPVVPDRDETAFCMRLASVAMFGDAIIGTDLNRSSGMDENDQRRFRRWLGELLTARLTPGQ